MAADCKFRVIQKQKFQAKTTLKNYENAIKDFSNAIDINPNDPILFYNKGLAYKNLADEFIFDKEKKRMKKRSADALGLIEKINSKLSNQNFLDRAPEAVIQREKSNLVKLTEEVDKLNANLEMLK